MTDEYGTKKWLSLPQSDPGMQVPRLSGMLRAFTTQQGNVDIAAQYQQRTLELESRRLKAGNTQVSCDSCLAPALQ